MKPLSEKDTQRLMSFYQQGNYQSAVEESKKLIHNYPKELILYNILGLCLERQGLFQPAAEAYQDALKINPAIPELQFNMGAMLYALDRWDDAISHYKKAIDINPNFTEAFFNMGITYQSQALFEKAIESYENAIKLQPGFYEAVGNIGTIKQLQGDLDNAIKYSIETPLINVSTENIRNSITLKISDNGIGMSKSVQKKIFEKFYREHTGNVHNVKGHGLGLAYVKQIIDDHHGEIFVESEKDKGTTFIIKLPLIS